MALMLAFNALPGSLPVTVLHGNHLKMVLLHHPPSGHRQWLLTPRDYRKQTFSPTLPSGFNKDGARRRLAWSYQKQCVKPLSLI